MLLAEDLSFEPIAFALPRNDSAFRLEVNKALTQVYVGGDIEAIFAQWLGKIGRPSGCSRRCISSMPFPIDPRPGEPVGGGGNQTLVCPDYNRCGIAGWALVFAPAENPSITRSDRVKENVMMKKLLRHTGITLLVAASAALVAPAAIAQSEQQQLVNSAETTLSNFLRDPQMTWLQKNIGHAKGVLIAPEVVKAGFIFGGSGGRGVLLGRGPDGKWHGPVFYTLARQASASRPGSRRPRTSRW